MNIEIKNDEWWRNVYIVEEFTKTRERVEIHCYRLYRAVGLIGSRYAAVMIKIDSDGHMSDVPEMPMRHIGPHDDERQDWLLWFCHGRDALNATIDDVDSRRQASLERARESRIDREVSRRVRTIDFDAIGKRRMANVVDVVPVPVPPVQAVPAAPVAKVKEKTADEKVMDYLRSKPRAQHAMRISIDTGVDSWRVQTILNYKLRSKKVRRTRTGRYGIA